METNNFSPIQRDILKEKLLFFKVFFTECREYQTRLFKMKMATLKAKKSAYESIKRRIKFTDLRPFPLLDMAHQMAESDDDSLLDIEDITNLERKTVLPGREKTSPELIELD